MELEKTLKMNELFSFYGDLLTPKQAEYMSDYYEEDYTLAEIADNHGVSRQAVYDSIKRTEETLLDYEEKLRLVEEFEQRRETLKKIKQYLEENYKEDKRLNELINEVIQDTIREEN
ncbi:MAG TPA: putative DNA-binding protein [Atopostipes sp.]|nr:putative DNA-binding protein [Atopostipes sp.]